MDKLRYILNIADVTIRKRKICIEIVCYEFFEYGLKKYKLILKNKEYIYNLIDNKDVIMEKKINKR